MMDNIWCCSKNVWPLKGEPGAGRDFCCCSSDNVSSFSRGWAQPGEQLCTQEHTPPPTPPPQPRNLSSVHRGLLQTVICISGAWERAALLPLRRMHLLHSSLALPGVDTAKGYKYTNSQAVAIVVQLFSRITSDSLRPLGLQHTRLRCPSPSPGVCSNLCPLNRWCHPTISSSATPFSTCLQSFPASGSFPMSQLFTLGGQGIGTSASGPSNE